MNKSWWVIVILYLLLLSLGNAIYFSNNENKPETENGGDTDVVESEWTPQRKAGSELFIIALDPSQKPLLRHLEQGNEIRLCAEPDNKEQYADTEKCSPILTVAGVSDEIEEAPWLALYVSSGELSGAVPQILSERRLLMIISGDATADEPMDRQEQKDQSNANGISDKVRRSTSSESSPQEHSIKVTREAGHIDLADLFVSLLEFASKSGEVVLDTGQSIKDLAMDAASSFFNAFSETVGEKTAEALFKRPENVRKTEKSAKSKDRHGVRAPMASVHFNLGVVNPPNEQNAFALTHEVVTFAKQHRDCDIVILGHTDRLGSRNANQRLSELRARSIGALISDIPSHRVEIRACGEEITTVHTADNVPNSENRRVDVFTVCQDITQESEAAATAARLGNKKCVLIRS